MCKYCCTDCCAQQLVSGDRVQIDQTSNAATIEIVAAQQLLRIDFITYSTLIKNLYSLP